MTSQIDQKRIYKDLHGRSVSYLRLSVTDRCNLKCRYCWSGRNISFIPHSEILRYEEFLRVISIVRQLGVQKIRLTGGEPLVRKGILGFIDSVFSFYPDIDLRLTTNATLLSGKVKTLHDIGVRRLNISLDTLDPETYKIIAGRDFFHQVRSAIDEALEIGMQVKINAVAMKGLTDRELPAFIDLARKAPLDVRFIEFMPMGEDTLWEAGRYWSADDILASAAEYADLVAEDRLSQDCGPARMYSISGGEGRLGLISPLSNHFCGSCNRLRVTADGQLRTCLFSDNEYRIRPLLRNERLNDGQILNVFKRAMKKKPMGHEILAARKAGAVAVKQMSAIGG